MHFFRQSRLRRGQAAIFITLSLVVMLGLIGFVVDTGWAYWRREACRAAAEAAASAAAIQASSLNPPMCSSPGIVCQSPTPCPAAPTSPPTNNIGNGCLYAKQNGFINSGRQTVVMEAYAAGSPVPGVNPAYWVRATVGEALPQTFSAILGRPWGAVSARSSAAVFAAPANACIYALSPTAAPALKVNGSVKIVSGCGMYDNSNSPTDAFEVGGNASVTASKYQVNGGVNLNGGGGKPGSVTCTGGGTSCMQTGVPPTPDPLGGLPNPNYPNRCDSTGITETSTIVMPSDGYYVVCGGGFSMNSNKKLTLPAGNYIFKGGAINLQNGTLRGDNVMFYFTGGVSSVGIAGNMDITLNANMSGDYRGVLMYQDRSQPIPQVTINGGSNQILNGALYFPTSDVAYSGGNQTINTYTALICSTIDFTGNAYFTADLGGLHNGLGAPQMAVVE